MTEQLLNITSTTEWKSAKLVTACNEKIMSWLLDEASLTSKLEQQYEQFSVALQQQLTTNFKQSPLSPYFHGETVLVREVLLHCDGVATVFAQTEIPVSTLSDEQKQLTELGNTSLGRVLFQNKSLQRGHIEIAEFSMGSEVHQLSDSLQQDCAHSLWARRSVFYIENKPLLVSEVFLPASGIYK